VLKDPFNARTNGFSGDAIDYMTKLEESLNFSCNVKEFKSTNNASNVGFSGFVREMGQCATKNGSSGRCECDMGVGGWASTRERQALVDFVHPFDNDAYRSVVRTSSVKDKSKTKGFFFISVFSVHVWVSIAGTMLLIAIIYMCDPHSVTRRSAQRSHGPEMPHGFDDACDEGSGGNAFWRDLFDLMGTIFFRFVLFTSLRGY
jgi:hypothetical protein